MKPKVPPNIDILDEMTKDEIIKWIRSQFSFTRYLPKKSELLWIRYQIEEANVSAKRDASIKRGKALDMTKRDEYAKQFNASSDIKEKMDLAEKMRPYENELKRYLDESMAIIELERKVDKLYAQIDIERKKEDALADKEV